MTFSSPRQADPVPDHAFGYPREDEWPSTSDAVAVKALSDPYPWSRITLRQIDAGKKPTK